MDFEKIPYRTLRSENLEHNPKAYENIPDILKKAEQVFVKGKEREGYKGDIGQSLRSNERIEF